MATYSLDEVMNADSGKKTYTLSEIVGEKPKAGEVLNKEIGSIPRQLGLTARAGVEGLGDIADFVATPVRVGLNALGGNFKPGVGSMIADKIGLPKPETTTEKVANTGARMLVPAGGFIKAGEALQKGGEVASGVGKMLAANPAMQLTSAASGGMAGEYVKETGGDAPAQFLASMAGGIAAPVAVNAMSRAPQAAMNASKRFVEAVAPGVVKQSDPAQINVIINNQLKDSGLNMQMLPQHVQSSIRQDVADALNIGSELNGDALRRLIDYRLIGATPRTGNLTLDPVLLTQQKNLAKMGANSKDPSAQLLARAENENNGKLIEGLNGLGANTSQDSYGAGQQIIGRLGAVNDAAKSVINNLYDKARNTAGRSAHLDPSAFSNSANDALDQALLGGKLPGDVRNLLNKVATGEIPLTVDVAEQFKTRIGELQRASSDAAERMALGKVRQSLDNTPLMGGQGQDAIDAFNKARRVNAKWMGVVDKTPALQAVRDGVEPDKFVNKFIIGNGSNSSVMDVAQLKNLVKGSPESVNAIKGQITSFLKSKALNGASDEVGNFSQSGFNKALDAIGDRKLKLFFSPEEVAQLKAIGRVASYEQVQPRGSAVNNSNTAGTAIATLLDRIGNSPLLSKIPLGKVIAEPAQNISVGLQSRNAVNVPASLVMPQQKRPLMLGVSPALGVGLLGSE